jgi:ferredoxin-thioredoxin reductase catalytic subunit
MYDKLKKSHRPYAEKIMYELYPDKELTIEVICSKFVKKRHAIVCSSIKDLEKCRLIKLINDSIKINERSYQLSKTGFNLIAPEILIDSSVE